MESDNYFRKIPAYVGFDGVPIISMNKIFDDIFAHSLGLMQYL